VYEPWTTKSKIRLGLAHSLGPDIETHIQQVKLTSTGINNKST